MAIFIIIRQRGSQDWCFLNRLTGENAEVNGISIKRERAYEALRNIAEGMAARWALYFQADMEIRVADTGLGRYEQLPKPLAIAAE